MLKRNLLLIIFISLCFHCLQSRILGYASAFYVKSETSLRNSANHIFGKQKLHKSGRMSEFEVGLNLNNANYIVGLSKGLFFKEYKSLKFYYFCRLQTVIPSSEGDPFYANGSLGIGSLIRLSSRVSYLIAGSIPIIRSNNISTSVLSFGLHYFYGSGINTQQKSSKVKGVKKKILGVIWIND